MQRVRVEVISSYTTHAASSRSACMVVAASMTRCKPGQMVFTPGSPSPLRARKRPRVAIRRSQGRMGRAAGETHHLCAQQMMGFATLYPSYACCSILHYDTDGLRYALPCSDACRFLPCAHPIKIRVLHFSLEPAEYQAHG